MTIDENDHGKQLAEYLVKAMPDEKRETLILWAHAVSAIQKTDWSWRKKLLQISRVTTEMGISQDYILRYAQELKRIGWDERSKSMRGLVGGLGIGLFLSISGPMAGLAAFGGAVAVPVILLSGLAGAGIGAVINDGPAIIEELRRKSK